MTCTSTTRQTLDPPLPSANHPTHPMDSVALIQAKPAQHLRVASFNINGCRAVLNYHPWSATKSFAAMFTTLTADIITLQELKVQRAGLNHRGLATVQGYRCFLTVPREKRGYSGVGCYVRVPGPEEDAAVRWALSVVRAEEGITGILALPDVKGQAYRDLSESECIGGYPMENQAWFPRVDSEGRCVVVELAGNVVVICVYCPANSMGTDEGEDFRIAFLECLCERVRNLERMGKQVLVMGDINVSRDMIDSADACQESVGAGMLRLVGASIGDEAGVLFERENAEAVEAFKGQSVPKALLNAIVCEPHETPTASAVLADIHREVHGRRLRMYTCWNTLKNARPSNHGSRIDLILATRPLAQTVMGGDILPMLHGSDHCPIYADFDPLPTSAGFGSGRPLVVEGESVPVRFEAKVFYKLQYQGLDAMFKQRNLSGVKNLDERAALTACEPSLGADTLGDKGATRSPPAKRLRPVYTSRKREPPKGQRGIAGFFTPKASPLTTASTTTSATTSSTPPFSPTRGSILVSEPRLFVSESEDEDEGHPLVSTALVKPLTSPFTRLGKPPTCVHGKPAELKTCINPKNENQGRRFWTCRTGQCKYFEWAL